jgi:hypothetical protein
MALTRLIARTAPLRLGFAVLIGFLIMAAIVVAQYPSQSEISKDGTAILLEDYVSLPLSSPTHWGESPSAIDFKGQLGRVNSLRSEPADAPLAASRFFVDDQNGTLYILDKTTKKFTPYLNFADIFPKFVSDTGNTAGIVSVAFDPGYAKNGKFYTVHVEKPDIEGPANPTNAKLSSLKLDGYRTTPVVRPPAGPLHFESVLIEWRDDNVRNATFEGLAREVLRVGFDRNHPMADMVFNPLARPGSDEYGNLYVSVGDGAQGETPGPSHTIPQRLDSLLGKILRITPDINLHPKDTLSQNGQYRVPSGASDPNPFVAVASARGEIFAYGFRNPHRMTWDVPSKSFIVNDIGLHDWEEINIVFKGANYGYSEREGNEQLFVDDSGKTGSQLKPVVPFPEKDDILHVDGVRDPVAPVYAAAVYSHQDGDAIGNGFVYRGKLMPRLHGQYIFNDMTTGRIFYVDLAGMIAAHGQRSKQPQIHELQIMYKSPYDNSNPSAVKRQMFSIVAEAYSHRGGAPAPERVLPGRGGATTGWRDAEQKQPKADPDGIVYGGGRADIRMALGGDGELYVLSKSDGMIRKIVAVVTPPPK